MVPVLFLWAKHPFLPAMHDHRSSISRVVGSHSSPESQQSSRVFWDTMVRPDSEMELLHFSLFFFAFLVKLHKWKSYLIATFSFTSIILNGWSINCPSTVVKMAELRFDCDSSELIKYVFEKKVFKQFSVEIKFGLLVKIIIYTPGFSKFNLLHARFHTRLVQNQKSTWL